MQPAHDAPMLTLVRERLDELYALRDDTEKLLWSERGRLSAVALETVKGGIRELERLLTALERTTTVGMNQERRERYVGSPGYSGPPTDAA